MSVKFEKDTIKQTGGVIPDASLGQTLKEGAQTLKDGKHGLIHNAGVVVTGGKEMEGTRGYLAVCDPSRLGDAHQLADDRNAGVLEAASDESPPNEDVDLRNVIGITGDSGLVDREGPKQEWTLFHR
jgi:hypothetical protein